MKQWASFSSGFAVAQKYVYDRSNVSNAFLKLPKFPPGQVNNTSMSSLFCRRLKRIECTKDIPYYTKSDRCPGPLGFAAITSAVTEKSPAIITYMYKW